MKTHKLVYVSLFGVTCALFGGSVFAQTGVASKSICMTTGTIAPEPVGDRDGHFIQVSQSTCRIEGGPLDGGVMTQNSIWEVDKGASTLSSSSGVIRKAGGIAVYQTASGTRTVTMKDGKVVGWTATGKSNFPIGGGTVAEVAGKSFTWTARFTGPNQYVIDSVMD